MFEYTIAHEVSCTCVTARGRIDALSAAEIKKVFNKLILEGERVLLADLSAVNYISSAGLRIFIVTQKELKEVGGQILLAGLQPQILEIFRISGLDKHIRIIASKDEIPTLGGNAS